MNMKSILMVDDNVDWTEMVKFLMEAEGHKVKVVHTIGEARRLLNSDQRFDIGVLDLMLPDGCGIELLDDRAFGRAVIITGHAGVHSFIKTVRGPNVAWLKKPVMGKQLVKAIEGKLTNVEDDTGTFSGCTIRQIERRAIVASLREHGGCKRAAAKSLGMSLNTLYNRIDSYQIDSAEIEALT